MAVQVWIGEKPEHPQERRAILGVAQALEKLEGLFLILANFSVNGRNIDLVIIKHNAIVIIELKHCDGRVIGSVNGPWFVEGRNGEQKRLNPGRKNPYNQVISYFHALTNFLNEHRREFLSEQKANDVDFRTCKRLIVIAPRIEEGSQLDLDWKVEVRGLDELPAYMITERSSEIELSEEEMLAIPKLLHCTPWTELNEVVRENAPPAPTKSVPLPWYVQARNALHTHSRSAGYHLCGLSLVCCSSSLCVHQACSTR
jgi:Nuclease-related domain.